MNFFEIKNLIAGLKAVGTSIVTSIIWLIPMIIARYFNNALSKPFVAIIIGLFSLFGYLLTWGYLSRKFWNWK